MKLTAYNFIFKKLNINEHLQNGRERTKGSITNFNKIMQASSNGKSKKRFRLFFGNISFCQSNEI